MSLNRRTFFKLTGTGAAATVTAGAFAQQATRSSAPEGNNVPDYPELMVANLDSLPENQPLSFSYPDEDSFCQILRLGRAVPGGIGPQQDIVAYSILCPHMGCPTVYDRESRRYQCGCHFSTFDAEMAGQQVIGQATQDLPRIELRLDADNGDIHAVGVQGLIYGRQANVLVTDEGEQG